MAGSMALVMLFFMRHMYKDKHTNVAIVIGSVALMGLGFWLVRSQATVGDVAWMKAMIPRHSVAILASRRANITDSRVRKLADDIIEAQREIEEMEFLLRDIDDQSSGNLTAVTSGELQALWDLRGLTISGRSDLPEAVTFNTLYCRRRLRGDRRLHVL